MSESPIEAACSHIDLWRIDLRQDRAEMRGDLLCPEESIRADKFAFAHDRERFVRSRSALRTILARYLNCRAAELEFSYNEFGKPELSFSSINSPEFNLSHTRDVALIAIAQGRNVGVDVSTLPPTAGQSLDWPAVAKRSFSVAEQTLLFALPVAEQERVFYQVWSQKEAYTKGIGEGYRYGFQAFTVVVETGGRTGLLADKNNPRFVDEWQLRRVDIGSDVIAVLAWDGSPGPRIRQYTF